MKLGEQGATRIENYAALDDTKMCYFKDGSEWYLYIPRCGLAGLRNHTVVENPDDTITVTPSILTQGHDNGESTEVHGYLTNGVWKDC